MPHTTTPQGCYHAGEWERSEGHTSPPCLLVHWSLQKQEYEPCSMQLIARKEGATISSRLLITLALHLFSLFSYLFPVNAFSFPSVEIIAVIVLISATSLPQSFTHSFEDFCNRQSQRSGTSSNTRYYSAVSSLRWDTWSYSQDHHSINTVGWDIHENISLILIMKLYFRIKTQYSFIWRCGFSRISALLSIHFSYWDASQPFSSHHYYSAIICGELECYLWGTVRMSDIHFQTSL